MDWLNLPTAKDQTFTAGDPVWCRLTLHADAGATVYQRGTFERYGVISAVVRLEMGDGRTLRTYANPSDVLRRAAGPAASASAATG